MSGAQRYNQKCQTCQQKNGIRVRCPKCKKLVCDECWGDKHNADTCLACEKPARRL